MMVHLSHWLHCAAGPVVPSAVTFYSSGGRPTNCIAPGTGTQIAFGRA